MDKVIVETRDEQGLWTFRGSHWIAEKSSLCNVIKSGIPYNVSTGAFAELEGVSFKKVALISLPDLRSLIFDPTMIRDFELIAIQYKTTCDNCVRILFIENP